MTLPGRRKSVLASLLEFRTCLQQQCRFEIHLFQEPGKAAVHRGRGFQLANGLELGRTLHHSSRRLIIYEYKANTAPEQAQDVELMSSEGSRDRAGQVASDRAQR